MLLSLRYTPIVSLFGLLSTLNSCRLYLETAVKNILLFQHEGHLYYLHIRLLVYVFLPLTWLIACQADWRLLEYILGLRFVLGIAYPRQEYSDSLRCWSTYRCSGG